MFPADPDNAISLTAACVFLSLSGGGCFSSTTFMHLLLYFYQPLLQVSVIIYWVEVYKQWINLQNSIILFHLFFFLGLIFPCCYWWDSRVMPIFDVDRISAKPLPWFIFCLVAHKTKIVCQAEMSEGWQDAPVTFQLERASVLQPSGQISNNRSSRKQFSFNRTERLLVTYLTSFRPLCALTKWCSVGYRSTDCSLASSEDETFDID